MRFSSTEILLIACGFFPPAMQCRFLPVLGLSYCEEGTICLLIDLLVAFPGRIATKTKVALRER